MGVFLPIVAALAALASIPGHAAELLVFAASSTTEAVTEVNALYSARANGAHRARAVFGSSGMMARQIENGAPADVFIAADRLWIDYLVRRELVRNAGVELFRNRLALIAPAGSALRIRIAPGFALAEALDAGRGGGRLAIADPGHAPAGRYARIALQRLEVWPTIARRTARANNVRQALALVERGEAPAGIVYASDAARTARVRLVGLFPAGSHPPIAYRAVIVAGREDRPGVRQYFAFLQSAAAAGVWREYGMLVD